MLNALNKDYASYNKALDTIIENAQKQNITMWNSLNITANYIEAYKDHPETIKEFLSNSEAPVTYLMSHIGDISDLIQYSWYAKSYRIKDVLSHIGTLVISKEYFDLRALVESKFGESNILQDIAPENISFAKEVLSTEGLGKNNVRASLKYILKDIKDPKVKFLVLETLKGDSLKTNKIEIDNFALDRFCDILKDDPNLAQILFEKGLNYSGIGIITYSSITSFFNGGGNKKALTPEQIDFVCKLSQITAKGKDSFLDLSSEKLNNIIAELKTEDIDLAFSFIKEANVISRGYNSTSIADIATIAKNNPEKIQNAKEILNKYQEQIKEKQINGEYLLKNPSRVIEFLEDSELNSIDISAEEYYRFLISDIPIEDIKQLPKILQEYPDIVDYVDDKETIVRSRDKIRVLAKNSELLNDLKNNPESWYMCSLLTEPCMTVEVLEKSMESLSKLNKDVKEKITNSLSNTYYILVHINARISPLITETTFDKYIESLNKIAKYDKEIAEKMANIYLNYLGNENYVLDANNLDYVAKLLSNGQYDLRKLAKIMGSNINFENIEKICIQETSLPEEDVQKLILETFDINSKIRNIESLTLGEKIQLYDELLNLEDAKKPIYEKCGIDINFAVSKLVVMLGAKRDVVSTPKEKQIAFLRYFLANNNQQSEQVIKKFDFAQYEKNGLPLRYTRTEFNTKVEELLSVLPKKEQKIILEHFGLVRGEKGFDGLPTNKDFTNDNVSENAKQVATQIQQEINSFTLDNTVSTGNAEVDNVLTALVQGLPEFTSIIGKEQHGTHAYSVDIHTLKVLQSAMNNPLYETLSDEDKTILKISALLHDTGKKGGVVDTGHAGLSADYTSAILEKYHLPQGIKDRIIDIVENHHWFEAYNTGRITAQDVAVRCRRPEDFKIYEILAKSDFENVNSDFHFSRSGCKTLEEFNEFMKGKMTDIQDALNYIATHANIIFDTKFVRNGIFFPKEEVKIGDEITTLKVLDFNKLGGDASLEEYGFAPGTTKDNSRFFVHMTSPTKADMEPVLILTANSLNQSTWSTSMIRATNNRTYSNRKFGFVLDVDQANISEAYYENLGSGTQKSIKDFERILFGSGWESRTYVRDNLLKQLNAKGYDLTEAEYGILSKQLFNKKYMTQLRKDITIGNKVIKINDLVECLEISRDQLFNGGNIHSEIVPINPRVKGLIAKVEKIEDCPQEFLQFAKDHDLPIILMKDTHVSY